MRLYMQKFLNSWRFFSLSSKQYKKFMEQAFFDNLIGLKQANIVVFVLAIISSLFPLLVTNDLPRAGVHYATAAAALLLSLAVNHKQKQPESASKRFITLMFLLYYANIITLGIVIDIWANPGIPAVTFMVGLCVALLLFVLPTLMHFCLHTIAVIVFLLLAYSIKEPHTWAVDTVNSLVAYLVGLFFFWKINSYRLSVMLTVEKEYSAEERSKALMDVCPLAVTLYDTDWVELTCNPASLEMFGLGEEYEFGNKTDMFMQEIQPDGRHRDEVDAELHKSLMETGYAHAEIVCLKADGTPMILETDYVRLDYGDHSLFASYCRDLTEERAMREKEREANEAVQQVKVEQAANVAKSKFLSNMSHEIRTPMSAIIGMTAIAKNTDDIARKDDCLIKIDKASKHLLGIINQILDISKIEAEQFKLDSYAFQFEKMIDELVSILSITVDEKRLNLVVELDKSIPRYIVSDEIRLAQVLTNLLTNAVKFTPEGGSISLAAQLLSGDGDGSILRVEVSDTGIGISQDMQPNLFDDFVQVESTAARRFAGTGLGLAISKRIVEMMGGSIGVESEPDKGSRFVFTIPVEVSDEADEVSHTAISGSMPQGEVLGLYKGYKILVAEDIEINREIVSALLEPTGLDIEYATDGTEVVQMLREAPERYDIIFMDIQMPGMDGITATKLIRGLGTEKSTSIPIVAMTANVFREDIDACLNAGMNDHLSKPLDIGQIMAKLRQYL